MREIQASEAKIHLPQLLDDVERGETIVISRHARPIARIVPEAHLRQAEVDRAIASIKALRQRTGKITVDELLSANPLSRRRKDLLVEQRGRARVARRGARAPQLDLRGIG